MVRNIEKIENDFNELENIDELFDTKYERLVSKIDDKIKFLKNTKLDLKKIYDSKDFEALLKSFYLILDKIKGVQTVQNIEIVNLNGGNYSQYGYDIEGATRNSIVYPSYDPCIFEVKYPKSDIKGRVITR